MIGANEIMFSRPVVPTEETLHLSVIERWLRAFSAYLVEF